MTRLAVLGFGDVGQALARQVADEDELSITSATDASGTVVDEDGLAAHELVAAKTEHGTVQAADGRTPDWDSRQAARRAPADVVVQLTPSDLADPTRGLAELQAGLDAGRDVATAAKDALACRPEAVRDAADGGRVRCSAAVGASTPALEVLEAGFAGDRLEHASAVLNGSTTFVLARMGEGAGFGQALDEARQAGLLEADPEADLAGHDAAAKAAILHQRAYGSRLAWTDVATEGITDIDPEACRQAAQRGMAIRLVARIDADGARVAPVQLPASSPLVVDGARACLRLSLAGAGDVVLAGPGAGPEPTAAAVLSDVRRLADAEGSARTAPRAPAGRA